MRIRPPSERPGRSERRISVPSIWRTPNYSRSFVRALCRCQVGVPLRRRRRHHAKTLKRNMTLILTEEVKELLVVLRRHVEVRSEEHTSELQSLAYLVC